MIDPNPQSMTYEALIQHMRERGAEPGIADWLATDIPLHAWEREIVETQPCPRCRRIRLYLPFRSASDKARHVTSFAYCERCERATEF